MSQLVFTSYSNVNMSRYLERFLERLKSQLLDRAPGGNLKKEDILFIAEKNIQSGDEWVTVLGDAVRECKVCIAICTPAFVASEYCGKEIRIFLERLRQWKELPGNAGASGKAIIPIIWVNTELPAVLKEFQYGEKDFPKEYLEDGMLTLCQLSDKTTKRTRVEIILAKRILAAAKWDLPPQKTLPHFDHIKSVFHQKQAGTRYGVALVSLVSSNLSSKPYSDPVTYRDVMDEACGPRIPWRTLKQDKNLQQELKEAKELREAILLLADQRTLNDPLFGGTIQTLDQEMNEQCALVLVREDDSGSNSTSDQQVEITLKGHFPAGFSRLGYSNWTTARSAETLSNALLEAITRIRASLVQSDPGNEVRDDTLVATATAAGIMLEKQPILTGP